MTPDRESARIEAMANELVCPFCGDRGFDLVGLKSHFFRWCEKFDAIESPEQELLRQRAAAEFDRRNA